MLQEYGQSDNKQPKKTNKRVHWAESVEDNEGKIRTKRHKIEHVKQEKKSFSLEEVEQIKASIKRHFSEGTYGELEEMLNKCSLATKIRIFSVDRYNLFSSAAVTNDIMALSFITKTVPQETAYNMLHEGNLSAFRCFLYHTRTIEKLNELNRQDRIEGFKIFLKIDSESVQRVFNDFDSKFPQTDPLKLGLRDDFTTALTQHSK
jgi:hypothetical protein